MTYLSVIHGVELKVKMDEKNRDLKGDPFVERLRSRLPREFRTKGKKWHFRTVYPDEPCPKSIRIDLLPSYDYDEPDPEKPSGRILEGRTTIEEMQQWAAYECDGSGKRIGE